MTDNCKRIASAQRVQLYGYYHLHLRASALLFASATVRRSLSGYTPSITMASANNRGSRVTD